LLHQELCASDIIKNPSPITPKRDFLYGGPHCLDKKRTILRYTLSGPPGRDPSARCCAELLLLAGRGCGTSRAPGETEVGSAGEQPTKG
jgi:hypothetical protein